MQKIRQSLAYVPWIPRAILELMRARTKLNSLAPKELLALNAQTSATSASKSKHSDRYATVDRVAFLLPRIAARAPWRSDCLVQALAAQHWLASYEIPTTIEIGVQRDEAGAFLAHAWLLFEGDVVLGGEVSEFAPLLNKS